MSLFIHLHYPEYMSRHRIMSHITMHSSQSKLAFSYRKTRTHGPFSCNLTEEVGKDTKGGFWGTGTYQLLRAGSFGNQFHIICVEIFPVSFPSGNFFDNTGFLKFADQGICSLI